jgi:murein L,D-transpeptidase YafK
MKKWLSIIIACFLIAAVVYYLYPEGNLPPRTNIQKIVVFKSRQIMQVYSQGQVVKTYSISIGQNGTGDKQFEGDKRTPEGNYVISGKND